MSLIKGTREKGVREGSTNSDLVQRDELKLARTQMKGNILERGKSVSKVVEAGQSFHI